MFKKFISDQEKVVEEMIRNNPEILSEQIDKDENLLIHFAVEHSAYHWRILLYIKLSFGFFFSR